MTGRQCGDIRPRSSLRLFHPAWHAHGLHPCAREHPGHVCACHGLLSCMSPSVEANTQVNRMGTVISFPRRGDASYAALSLSERQAPDQQIAAHLHILHFLGDCVRRLFKKQIWDLLSLDDDVHSSWGSSATSIYRGRAGGLLGINCFKHH